MANRTSPTGLTAERDPNHSGLLFSYKQPQSPTKKIKKSAVNQKLNGYLHRSSCLVASASGISSKLQQDYIKNDIFNCKLYLPCLNSGTVSFKIYITSLSHAKGCPSSLAPSYVADKNPKLKAEYPSLLRISLHSLCRQQTEQKNKDDFLFFYWWSFYEYNLVWELSFHSCIMQPTQTAQAVAYVGSSLGRLQPLIWDTLGSYNETL